MSTHYDLLGVPTNATAEDIKRAYRAFMRTWHPDVAGPDGAARSAQVTAAYAVLADENRRAAYDQELVDRQSSTTTPTHGDDEWGTRQQWVDSANGEHTEPSDVQQPGATPDHAGHKPGHRDEQVLQLDHPTKNLWRTLLVATLTLVGLTILNIADPIPALRNVGVPAFTPVLGGGLLGVLLAAIVKARLPGGSARSDLLWISLAVALVTGAEVASSDPGTVTVVRVLQPLVVAASAVAIASHRIREQRYLDATLPRKSIQENNVFGPHPGGAAADLFGRDAMPLYDFVGLREVRARNESAPYSYAFICGTKVVLVRPMVVPPGTYHWSGPTLLLWQQGMSVPQEVLRGPFPEALAHLRDAVGNAVDVQAWVVLYASDGGRIEVRQQAPPHPILGTSDEAIGGITTHLTEHNNVAHVDQTLVVRLAQAIYEMG